MAVTLRSMISRLVTEKLKFVESMKSCWQWWTDVCFMSSESHKLMMHAASKGVHDAKRAVQELCSKGKCP